MTEIADIGAGRQCLRVSGTDAASFLHGQCTNDIRGLPIGDNCYAAFLNVKGKMRGDGHILRLPGEFVIEVSQGLPESLQRYVISEEVTLEPVELRQYLVFGDLPAVEAYTYRHPLGTGLLTAAELPVTVSDEEYQRRRIEAGVPAWRVDMDETTFPVEAGLTSAISYVKGCYIGQETIARIRTYGHVNRHLCQLAVAGNAPPLRGVPILAGERVVGQVTSTVFSNRLGKIIALGYVRREFATPASSLAVAGQPVEVIKPCAI